MNDDSKLNQENGNTMDFLLDDGPVMEEPTKKPYKVLIVDDENEMHTTTRMVLKGFRFEGRGLEIIDAFTGKEARDKLYQHPDLALIMLDVVMEESDSGLQVVDYIRNTLKNKNIRIILRTGQPGEAPEERIITEYDINDYRLKTELTVQRLYTSLYEALRSYRDIMALEHIRIGLEKIITVSSQLFVQGSVTDFYNCILEQMMFFREDDTIIYFRDKGDKHGIVFTDSDKFGVVIAATGRYREHLGKSLQDVGDLCPVCKMANDVKDCPGDNIVVMEQGYLVYRTLRDKSKSFIFIEGKNFNYDLDLIRTFLAHYSEALDNYILNQEIIKAQSEVIRALGDFIEKRPQESSSHVNRVSDLSVFVADKLGFTPEEKSVLKVASILHDTGKAGISETLLLKPSALTSEEFNEIKRHSEIGSSLFSHSNLHILRWATEICRHHHEHFDGKGYPEGLSGKDIPIASRIVGIADTLDSLTHNNPTRVAWSMNDAFAYMESNRGTQFDPELVDVVLGNRQEIEEILSA